MEQVDPPKSSNKRKKKKKKHNDDHIKEQSTKKKKKQPQQRTKKKNQQKTPNHSRKKKKKNNQNVNGKQIQHNHNGSRKKKKFKKKRKKKQYNKQQYKLGAVIIVPKNKNTWGWVYCEKNNMMYKLNHSMRTATVKKDQKILFTSNSQFVTNTQQIHIISLDTVTNNYLNDKKETIASKDRFVWNTNINCSENNCIEFKSFWKVKYNKKFKENFIKMIEKYLNGFINMNGGTIYIGINDKGMIKGIDFINSKEFDILQQLLPDRLNKWKPEIYTRTIIKSLKFEMKEIIVANYIEKCAYIIPNYKVIEASIKPIYDENKQVICHNSDGFVYCREGTSLAVYSNAAMTNDYRCSKRKLHYKGRNYGFWEPWNKNKTETVVTSEIDLTVFDEGDDVDLNGSENKIGSNTSGSDTTEDSNDDLNAGDEDESHSIIYMNSDNESDSDDIDSDEDEIDKNNMKYVREYKEDIDSDEVTDDNKNMKYVKTVSDNKMENKERRKSYSALFDYHGGQIPNELMFKRNEEIIVDGEKQNGLYLHGYKPNAPNDSGWFPNSYAKQIQ